MSNIKKAKKTAASRKYEMKKSIFDTISKDLVLREKIGLSEGIMSSSVRVNAINQSDFLTKYNTVMIIAEHLNLEPKTLFNINKKAK